MPHAGLMNERSMGPVDGPLQRARLHIRGGKRRLRQGKISAGIATLADALSAALEWFSHPAKHDHAGADGGGRNSKDDRTLYLDLVRSGKVSGSFDYDAFDRLTEKALNNDLESFDPWNTVAGFEALMTELGVLPFDEAMLPPEDPGTF